MRRTSIALAGLWLTACQPQGEPREGDTGQGEAAREIATQVPDTDIFLLELDEAGAVLEGSLRNLTRRPGYDNQPAFLPGGQRLLYSAIVEDSQSEVYELDLAADASRRLTRTAESEYSPTPLPDGGFSVVRVEADGSQYLWRYSAGGEPGQIVMPGLGNVGYHRWLDDGALVLFLVGEPMSLVLADPDQGATRSLATGAGRAFASAPDGGLLLVMPREADSWTLCRWQGEGAALDCRLDTPGRSQDFALDGLGRVWMAWEQSLYRWQPGQEGGWETVVDLAGQGLAGQITRLAFSDDGRRLALVVNMQVENTQ